MRLLGVHRLLIGAAVALSLLLILWGGVHALRRKEATGWLLLGLGAITLPLSALYLRKLFRNPPI